MAAFVAYDAQVSTKTSKGSKRNAKILFVDCNDGGRPSEQSKASLNRHAAIKSRIARPVKKDRCAALHEDSTKDKATSAKALGPTTLRFRVNEQKPSFSHRIKDEQVLGEKQEGEQAVIRRRKPSHIALQQLPGDPRSASLITNTPFGAFRSPSPNVDDRLITTVIDWFFLGKDEAASRGTLEVATDHWMKQLWHWATTHEA